MKFKSLQSWRLTPKEAIELQMKFAKEIKIIQPTKELKLIAGVDAIFNEEKALCLAAVIVWNLKTQKIIEERLVQSPLQFPYIPGLLSFREGPAILAGLEK